MEIDWGELTQKAYELMISFGFKLLGAIAIWIIGRMLINMALRGVERATQRTVTDETLRSYLSSSLRIVLNIALIVALLGFFGVETTTFAALLAAGGVAIGMAWSGLLANFASGVFLLVLRPFQRGDFIEGGGVTGTVEEIGLFVTTIHTPDNIRTFVGNDSIFKGTIRNYSANPHRRVELTAQLAHDVDHRDAIERLEAALAKIPNVLDDPAPEVVILEFNLAGPVLGVRPFCHTDHYWQVYFDTNEVIRDICGEAGYAVPQKHLHIQGALTSLAAAE